MHPGRLGRRYPHASNTHVGRAVLGCGRWGGGSTLTVHCERGQSFNGALAKLAALNEIVPVTVNVTGTCTEYVQIREFQGLALKGLSGATIVQPAEPPGTSAFTGVLTIEAFSRSVRSTVSRSGARASQNPASSFARPAATYGCAT